MAAVDNQRIEFRDESTTAKNANFSVPINLSNELGRHLDEGDRYLVKKVDEQSKVRFSQYFQRNATAEDCEAFKAIFEWLETTIRVFREAREE